MTLAWIRIEVVYAEPQRSISKPYTLPEGSLVADARRLAAQEPDFAGIDVALAALGVFGTSVPETHVLKQGDRVEIYRPLVADPKTARRARAKAASKSGRS